MSFPAAAQQGASRSPKASAVYASAKDVFSTGPRHVIKQIPQIVLFLIMVAGDLVMITAILDYALPLPTIGNLLIALVLTAGSLAAMYMAGKSTKEAQRQGKWSVVAAGLFISWVLLGSFLTAMRWNSHLFTQAGPTAAGSGSEGGEILIALLMAAAYALSGTLAFREGFVSHNPVARAFQDSNSSLAKTDEDISALEQQEVLLEGRVALQELEAKQTDGHLQIAHREIDELVLMLQNAGRVRIAFHTGDPAETGVTRFAPRDRRTARPELHIVDPEEADVTGLAESAGS